MEFTWQRFHEKSWTFNELTHKQLEMHGCILNTVDTDALVLKHQVTSIHSE